jgi:hypothetical protein
MNCEDCFVLFCFVFLFFCYNTQILHNLNPPTTTTTTTTTAKLATKFFNRWLLCEAQQQQTRQRQLAKLQGSHESEVEENLRNRQTQ